ncbi:MAG: glutamate-semialdehyde -aminomutase [Solirubrobacteraceae bacterium]|jgi:glutamate-1-semialdehyde aminotransferase|nr:glutamate-semialdehyde -aminomutase [Solirubrobacteraceae bacterium]
MSSASAGPSSQSLIERSRRSTAAEIYDIGTRFPGVYESAEGSWMRDFQGNRCLDVTAASGALLLGNRDPQIVDAICQSIQRHGSMFASTLSMPRIELAERLCDWFPCGEKAVFGKTGSEATLAAVRLARAATGRDLVLTCGFHGWHDWHLRYLKLGYDPPTGVVCFGYNETYLERLLDEFSDRIAAVFITPEPAWFDAEVMRRWSALCASHDVLFMIDEVVTAFRYGPHGVNGTGEVPADLITISKGLANGHSLAAVIGRRDLIDAYDDAGVAGTYTREVPPMAAALKVLDIIADGSVHERCQRLGTTLMEGMRDVLKAVGIPAWLAGPSMMFDVVVGSEQLSWDIYRAAFDHGAWFEDSGTHMVTAAFGDAEVQHAIDAFEQGARRIAERDGFDGGEIGEERRREFAREAFGGALVDDEELLACVERTVGEIAAHAPSEARV